MPAILGLDIGSNSVGSAWIDTDARQIHMAASVFPAGVDEKEDKRGAPRNQARRESRSQRRTIHRRAIRKRKLSRFLIDHDLLPRDPEQLQALFETDPWQLRRKALDEVVTPHEFGRVLIHVAQRRGAVGITSDPDHPDEGKVKEGMDRLNKLMHDRGSRTIGEFLATLKDERKGRCGETVWNEPIRNRQYRIPEQDQLFAGRELVRQEFKTLVAAQRAISGSPLAKILTDDFVAQLDAPRQSGTWRHSGLLFGQRRTYWDTGTLGRCALEPTERCVPIADRHAAYFRVIETVNNIRIETKDRSDPLSEIQRNLVIALLRGPLGKHAKGKHAGKPRSSVSITDIRTVLGLGKAGRTNPTKLNVEADPDREINTDWFHREIVHAVFTESGWSLLGEETRESLNRAILKFDPDQPDDAERLRKGAMEWWRLESSAAERLVESWKARPKLETRLKLSRRSVLTLLPYMQVFDAHNNRWPTQQEARKAHAATLQTRFASSGECADRIAAERYSTGAIGLTAADRYYMRLAKHQIAEGVPELPPAPTLSNPVVRKAIHEVRRHLLAWMRKFRRKPDRVVIEFARGVKDTAKRRNEQLAANREREKERIEIETNLAAWGVPKSNWAKATLRIRLCREQSGVCPFSVDGSNSSRTITERMAAEGADVEIEHIVPEGLSGKTMAFNNLVLCFREANRGKGMRTPADWLGPERSKLMLRRVENAPLKENRVKWERLSVATPDEEGFRNSQLTDTAYAARQVAAYIADALYDGQGLPERGGDRRIFTTKGEYTARLRADWGLHESTIDRAHGLEAGPNPEEVANDPHMQQASRRARKDGKDRTDHRHHAIDALAIAMVGPDLLTHLGRMAREDREYRERTGHWPRRKPVPHPPAWPTPEAFQNDVVTAYDNLIVCSRPVKRRLIGAFHKEEHYGPVIGPLPTHRTEKLNTLFTNRISADRLTPNHLRVPDGWDELSYKVNDETLPDHIRRGFRRDLAALEDLSPGKSGIVRDRALRDTLRRCLRAHGVDPDDFGLNNLKRLVADGKLRMSSGVPIKGVVLLRTHADPVIFLRKRPDILTGEMIIDSDPRTARVYERRNNHHIEIREDRQDGSWSGELVSTFDAAIRVRRDKLPAVNRTDDEATRFVMSLAEGEIIHARRKDRDPDASDAIGYFVVCKLDKPARIHFAPHWDARKAVDQDRWDVTPADLRRCGLEVGKPPVKVRVSPLGDIKVFERD